MLKKLKICSYIIAALMLTALIPLFGGCFGNKEIAIYFNSNGGSAVETMHFTQTTIISSKDLPVPTKDGFIFRGWSTNNNVGGTFENIKINQKVTLNAYWVKAHNVNLIIDKNQSPYIVTEAEDEIFIPSKNYNIDGFMIEDWYQDETFQTIYQPIKLTSDITLYAKLVPAYEITFVTNGGSEVASKKIAVGESTYITETSEKEGFKFEGWYEDAAFTIKHQNRVLEGNLILYARFIHENVVTLSASNFKSYFSFSSDLVSEKVLKSYSNLTATSGYKYYYTINVKPKLEEYATSEHSSAQIKVKIKLLLSQYKQGNVSSSSDFITYFELVLNKQNGFNESKTFETFVAGSIYREYYIASVVNVQGEIYVN